MPSSVCSDRIYTIGGPGFVKEFTAVAGFLGCAVAAVWGFGRTAAVGFAGVCCRPALLVAGFGGLGVCRGAGGGDVFGGPRGWRFPPFGG